MKIRPFIALSSWLAVMIAIIAFEVYMNPAFAASSNSTVTANVAVGNVIYLAVTPNTIYFNGLAPNSITTTSANDVVTDYDNGGNLAANILVYGSNLVNSSSNTILLVGNTIWNATTGKSATLLTNSFVNTGITILQPNIINSNTSNKIYFGINIPSGTPPGNYIQTIYFENENLTSPATYNSPSTSNSVQLVANVAGYCYISLAPNSISFGSVVASSNVPTNVLVTDSDNGGNVAANVLVEGANWYLNGNIISTSFGVSNTLWDASSQTTYIGTALSNTLISTPITIPAPTISNSVTSNQIYFGLAVPGGTPAGSYEQTITIENSC
ncbi:MAG: hypothetical protein ACP5MZ_03750 [Candidatus Micrarchaeia archaeon]